MDTNENKFNLIKPLVIEKSNEHNLIQSTNSDIVVDCKALILDPDHPMKRDAKYITFRMITKPNVTIQDFLKDAKNRKELKNYSLSSDTYVKINHRLYNEGELHSISGSICQEVEIVSLESEKQATINEGFIFAFWSLVPLIVAVSFIIPGLIGTFDIVYRGLFILVGTIIGIPASILFLIGITERNSQRMRISFVNQIWFGPCCSPDCCCCECGCCCCKTPDIEQENVDQLPKSPAETHHHEDTQALLSDDNSADDMALEI